MGRPVPAEIWLQTPSSLPAVFVFHISSKWRLPRNLATGSQACNLVNMVDPLNYVGQHTGLSYGCPPKSRDVNKDKSDIVSSLVERLYYILSSTFYIRSVR